MSLANWWPVYIWRSKIHELSTGSAELGEFFLFVGAYTVGQFDCENSNHGKPHDQTS